MPKAQHLTIEEAERKATETTGWLLKALADFNAYYPDPDAKEVDKYFDYFTDNYVLRTCATVLAESHIVSPSENEPRISMRELRGRVLEVGEAREQTTSATKERTVDEDYLEAE